MGEAMMKPSGWMVEAGCNSEGAVETRGTKRFEFWGVGGGAFLANVYLNGVIAGLVFCFLVTIKGQSYS